MVKGIVWQTFRVETLNLCNGIKLKDCHKGLAMLLQVNDYFGQR